jgi:hypothetical protein
MDLFTQLFGSLLAFVYHCFDRIVIYGYLSGLSRPERVVNFFHQVVGVPVVSGEILSQRTADYQNWAEAFARNHRIPIEWAEKGVRKEDHVLPWQRRTAAGRNSSDSRITAAIGMQEWLQASYREASRPVGGPQFGFRQSRRAGNRQGLDIRLEVPQQPDHLDVAMRLELQPTARTHTAQVAVDVELQEIYRDVTRSRCRLRLNAGKTRRSKIQPINKCINESHST